LIAADGLYRTLHELQFQDVVLDKDGDPIID